ncbi:RNA polymerase sigma-70 factor [Robertkochia solimangrovi]|uniref:RNA polymerase sigma-70 factor n=1 Tax=Robertkochia solimangrovi TaxID=2213046 RepID=UPI0013A531D2|nr:RNA polymerase sigma-70 factor [Robertkochia solimangrovi]
MKQGDHKAYETLFQLYFDKLHHYAWSYLEDAEEAREIIQNVFFKLWKKRTDLKVDMNLNAYLFKMTRNECLDYFKHLKVKTRYRDEIQKERLKLNVASLQDDPSQMFIESELNKKVNSLINRLPDACREVFIKSRFEGLKYHEIAAEMNISPKTVENQISKALRFLRQELQDYLTLFL